MQRKLKRPGFREVFELSSREVRKVLVNDLQDAFEFRDNQQKIIANCFVTRQKIAHVVYFPAANLEAYDNDIALNELLDAVQEILEKEYFQELTIKKYLTIAVNNKTGIGQQHFVAITEINKQLTVVNPRKKHVARFSNPDISYLKENLPELADEALAADRQKMLDNMTSGYFVAAIHACAANDAINDFESAMQNMPVDNLYLYEETRPKQELSVQGFFTGSHVLDGIMIALGIFLLLAAATLVIVLTYGTTAIAIGGALTFAAAYAGSSLGLAGMAAQVIGATIIGLGLGSVAVFLGAVLGAIAEVFTDKKSPVKTNMNDDLDDTHESQSVIRQGMKPLKDNVLFKKGNKAYEEKNYEQAIVHYQQVLEVSPHHAKTWQYCGDAYFAMKNYPKAIAYYREAMKIDPEYMLAYRYTAEAYFKLERYEEAIVFFERAIKLNGEYAQAYEMCGDAYLKLGEYYSAIHHYGKALELEPNNTELLIKRGKAREGLGKEEVEADYSRARLVH